MGGGILQLVAAKSVETIYLINNPQVTMFKVAYRRHTNFSLFDHDIHFSGKLSFKDTSSLRVKHVGDILNDLSLIIDLPDFDIVFDEPTVSNIKYILSTVGIKWNTERELGEIITEEIYDDEIIPVIQARLTPLLNDYNTYNNVLRQFDNNYSKKENVYDYDYYVLLKDEITHNIIAIDSSHINIDPETRDLNETYVFINTTDNPISSDNVTITPETDLLRDDDNNYIYVTEEYMTQNSDSIDDENEYLAIKISSLGDYASSQTIDVSTNGFKIDGAYALFPQIEETSLFRTVAYENIKRNVNDNIELLSTEDFVDEYESTYFIYDVDGIDISGDTLNIDSSSDNILKDADDNVITLSKAYLDNYTIPDGSHTRIAIKKSALPDSGSVVVDLTENGYIKTGDVTYTVVPEGISTSSESLYVLLNYQDISSFRDPIYFDAHNSLIKNDDNEFLHISETTISLRNSITLGSDSFRKTDVTGDEDYVLDTVNTSQLSRSTLDSTHYAYLVKKSEVVVDGDNLTFSKDDIIRGQFEFAYAYYKNNISRPKTVVNNNKEIATITSSNQVEHIRFNVLNDDDEEEELYVPYVFLLESINSLLDSDEMKIDKILYDGLLALFVDLIENPSRNIRTRNMNEIKILMYHEFISRIFDVDNLYGDYVLSYIKSGRSNDDDIIWTDPTTGATSTKTLYMSNSKENILLLHAFDMSNYTTIPIKSNNIGKYFDYVITNSYSSETSYTILDSYQIYKNFIAEFNQKDNSALTIDGTYDSLTVINTANNLVQSIGQNYLSNGRIFREILNALENVTTISDNPIHTSVVYKGSSPYSNSSIKLYYGALNHNGDTRNMVNIIDEINRVGQSSSGNLMMYYRNRIEVLFNTFLDKIRSIASSEIYAEYFGKLIYWNECLGETRISGAGTTSMVQSLKIDQTNTTYNSYIAVYGNSTCILTHLPYALLQNIPYTIYKIILDGSKLDIASNKYTFPTVSTTDGRNTINALLIQFIALELTRDNFTETYTDGDNATINKRTLLETLEETMFNLTIGDADDRSNTSLYYNKDYFKSLRLSTDSSQTIYTISTFMPEPIASLDALSFDPIYGTDVEDNTKADDNIDISGFDAESNLTATEYIIKSFERLYKRLLVDFVGHFNRNYFIDDSGDVKAIGELGGDTQTFQTFTLVEDIYTCITDVLATFGTTDIIDEASYVNTYSVYSNTEIFTNARESSVDSHNYRFLDIQSSIWNSIQKRNIRTYNELFYNGILSRTELSTYGGINLLTFYDNLLDTISGIDGTPTFYHSGYTAHDGTVHSATYNSDYDDQYSPIGRTGIDYYRIRLSDQYDSIKTILDADNNYFTFLLNSRYHQLKSVLNIKTVSLFQRSFTFNTVEEIVKQLAIELVTQYNINSESAASDIIEMIGYEDGGELSNVALSIFNNYYSPMDIITGTDNEATANSEDNIYKKLSVAISDDYDDIELSDPNLYAWVSAVKATDTGNSDLNSMFTKFTTILGSIAPSTLYLHQNISNYFNNYVRYSDCIFFIIDQLILTNSFISPAYSNINSGFTNEIEIYDDITNRLVDNIVMFGNNIFKISIFVDTEITTYVTPTEYTDPDTGDVSTFRYLPIESSEITIEGSETDLHIQKLLSDEKPKYRYVKELGHRLIEYISISMDDQVIDIHDDELISHLANVNTDEEHRRGYNILIGNTEEMQAYNSETKPIKRLQIPLWFWFKYKGNGIPLINTMHTDVIIKIKLRGIDDILVKETGSRILGNPRLHCKLLGNFVYLDEEERYKMAKSRLEYLVERYQYSGEYIYTKENIYNNNKLHLRLYFTDPTKYIYWKLHYDYVGEEEDKFDWIVNEIKVTNELTGREEYLESFQSCRLKFNGRTREMPKDYQYYNTYHPYTKGINNMRPGEFVYSFALRPLEYQPSGAVSLTNIEDFSMVLKLSDRVAELINNGTIILRFKVWSCSLNILAYISGMAGLRFHSAS